MKFKKDSHLVLKRLYPEETPEDRAKVLYCTEDGHYVLQFKPTSRGGGGVSYPLKKLKHLIERDYELDDNHS